MQGRPAQRSIRSSKTAASFVAIDGVKAAKFQNAFVGVSRSQLTIREVCNSRCCYKHVYNFTIVAICSKDNAT